MARGSTPTLFETLRVNDGVLQHGERHLARLAQSAEAYAVPFNREDVDKALAGLPAGTLRLRIDLSPGGTVSVRHQPFGADTDSQPLEVAWAEPTVRSTDLARRHKTSDRAIYDAAAIEAQQAGLADLLFLNELGYVAEGAISNLFVMRDGTLLTPPIEAGALPGILRAELLEQGRARVADLLPDAVRMAEALYLGSSLRGLRKVVLREDAIAVRVSTGVMPRLG